MGDLPLYDSDETNDPLVHVQVLFNSLSDEDGWCFWSAIATVTRKSGQQEDLGNMFTNREDGYLSLLELLQETHKLDVSKDDLKVNQEDGKPRKVVWFPPNFRVDSRKVNGTTRSVTVFVIEKDL